MDASAEGRLAVADADLDVEELDGLGRKDVWGGAGATNTPVGVGTVPASRKKRRRSLVGRARRLAGYKNCDCPPGQHTKDGCDG